MPGHGPGTWRSTWWRLRIGLVALSGAAAWMGLADLAASRETTGAAAAPMLDTLLPTGRLSLPLAEIEERVRLSPDQDVRVAEIGRDAHASQHVVGLRHGEEPHRHVAHDLLVVMLRGHGSMLLGDESRPVGPGSILFVPRGAVHAFTNESGAPAVAYAVYSPPFDGKDRVTALGREP